MYTHFSKKNESKYSTRKPTEICSVTYFFEQELQVNVITNIIKEKKEGKKYKPQLCYRLLLQKVCLKS